MMNFLQTIKKSDRVVRTPEYKYMFMVMRWFERGVWIGINAMYFLSERILFWLSRELLHSRWSLSRTVAVSRHIHSGLVYIEQGLVILQFTRVLVDHRWGQVGQLLSRFISLNSVSSFCSMCPHSIKDDIVWEGHLGSSWKCLLVHPEDYQKNEQETDSEEYVEGLEHLGLQWQHIGPNLPTPHFRHLRGVLLRRGTVQWDYTPLHQIFFRTSCPDSLNDDI